MPKYIIRAIGSKNLILRKIYSKFEGRVVDKSDIDVR